MRMQPEVAKAPFLYLYYCTLLLNASQSSLVLQYLSTMTLPEELVEEVEEHNGTTPEKKVDKLHEALELDGNLDVSSRLCLACIRSLDEISILVKLIHPLIFFSPSLQQPIIKNLSLFGRRFL